MVVQGLRRRGCAMAASIDKTLLSVLTVLSLGVCQARYPEEVQHVKVVPVVMQIGGEKYDWRAGMAKFIEKKYSNLSEDRIAEANEWYVKLARAYTNEDISAIFKLKDSMPSAVTNMPDRIWIECRKPLMKAFKDNFLNRPDSRVPLTLEKLKAFWGVNFAVASEICRLDIERISSGAASHIERDVYLQLCRQRDYFKALARNDLLEIVDEYYIRWCDHLESSECFTRQYVVQQLVLQFRAVEVGAWSITNAMTFVRTKADGLIKAGFKPKWLEAEFPIDGHGIIVDGELHNGKQ